MAYFFVKFFCIYKGSKILIIKGFRAFLNVASVKDGTIYQMLMSSK